MQATFVIGFLFRYGKQFKINELNFNKEIWGDKKDI
jgi:hypothetical protein